MVSTKKKTAASEVMVVNDSPGEECRIAILQKNHLEELFTERVATATNVGNIYKGRVTNVEPAIQAAFIDYGEGQAGFLHISDLHPRYFPGAKRTERVGKKIPRRSRPPIQEALRRGDEVLVQVLKEGVGTKGPTLTSYLSVPGRLLVMMPEMDRVGVSRKVEDPEARRKMRDILDTLTLPEGFGFILRTAGFGQTKTELNRDVAYLTRLWKVMEKRINDVGAPCELYTESDLFVRTLRDILRPSIEAIVVDSEQAYDRARNLLRVVAPRSAPRLIRYVDAVPIFHAFDIERQIELIHSREVPLPSGGKLVIEQTEALVAIDVNSGRSRRARDSETNAFETNCEAVDEICRQLRLRDLGGLVINDLIDMHAMRHRRQIEDQFREGLSRDRAKTTMLRISEFGIVELTRQRMRPSLRKSHFADCPLCEGRGEIMKPESVGADAARQAGYLLDFDRVRRLELVCSPKVASVLLSSKRRELVALEDASGKKIDVRVSDTIPADYIDFHAYDERNAEIDLTKLPAVRVPTLDELEAAAEKGAARPQAKSRRERRRRGSKPADAGVMMLAAGVEAESAPQEPPDEAKAEDGTPAKKKTRRRRRSRGKSAAAAAEPKVEETRETPIRVHQLASELGVTSREVISTIREEEAAEEVKSHMSSLSWRAADLVRKCLGMKPATPKTGKRQPAPAEPVAGKPPADETPGPEPVAGEPAAAEAGEKASGDKSPTRRRRRRRRSGRKPDAAPAAEAVTDDSATETQTQDKPKSSSRSGRSRKRRRKKTATTAASPAQHNGEHAEPARRETPAETAAVATATATTRSTATRPAPKRLYRSRKSVTRGGRTEQDGADS